MRSASIAALAFGVAALPHTAQAQRAEENAVASAEDAFGTSVGHETIGLYDEGNVRGFSPSSAGNIRMEGMYFDIQGGLSSRVLGGEVIHVGPSTQGYLFPAPTGIADLSLR
ncbi:MAG: TonB-dependent receptor, partial [Novosphingobium sp.]|nr:TonB-dependent receptor [Novosphingobium sp.]